MNNENNLNEISKVSYAGIYLGLSIILVFIQIPIPTPWGGIAIDLGLVPVIIARRHIGDQYAIIIAFIYPWFTLAGYIGGAIPGVLALILLSLMFVASDYLFAKITRNYNNSPKKYTFSWMCCWHFLAMLIISFVLLIFNLFLFWPMYLDGWMPSFDNYYLIVFIITIVTTTIRYIAVYLLISFIYPKIYHYL